MAVTEAATSASESDTRSFRLVFDGVTCDDCGRTVPVTRTLRVEARHRRGAAGHEADPAEVMRLLAAVLGLAGRR